MRKFVTTSILCILSLTITSCGSNEPISETSTTETETLPSQILFDDFSYTSTDEMAANRWIV